MMHEGEPEIDEALVERLLKAQFPSWAGLPLSRLPSAGTDNAIYRLGDTLAVRLPRIHWAVGQVEKECFWLPRLAPALPLAIPTPRAMGSPGEGYPWHWYVYEWLEGESATRECLADLCAAARALAEFILALQKQDTTGGPSAGAHNSGRGVPLAQRDAATRAAIAALQGRINTDAVTQAWEAALRAPKWSEAPVWVHGDLHSGNLLASQGHLSAVIDFGCLGVGDPAVELIVAWNLFSAEARTVFRATLGVDDATWERGRGWALSVALIALPYYLHTNPMIVASSHHTLSQAIIDC
jgi:aminoglycoside phosphotransferase (APT) family kinase protein